MSDPQPLVVTGPIIVEGILVLNVNYKQVNIPLCSDSHMPFSKVTCQGFWSELPTKTAPYLLSMEGYPYRHLPVGLFVQGPNDVPSTCLGTM